MPGRQIIQFFLFSVLEKVGHNSFLQYLKNPHFWRILQFKTIVFIASKYLKVFNTSLFLETIVFSKYFKNTSMPSGVLACMVERW
jgi:hypothetical protein